MSAPSIPNLLSLGGGGGRRGRGRGGGRSSSPDFRSRELRRLLDDGPDQSDEDIIQGTDTDAAVSRLSAVDLGYLDDPYAKHFVLVVGGPPTRRFPIINRGTYTRTTAVDVLIQSFLSSNEYDFHSGPRQRQIVSLGAGSDTRPFRLFAQLDPQQHLVYHEVDFEVTSADKLSKVETNPELSSILDNRSTESYGNWSSRPSSGGEYHSHGMDISDLSCARYERIPGIRRDIPTLVLSECCLCYLPHDTSEGILQYFSSRIPNLAVIIYEPIHLGDAFSDTMVSNLAARDIHMPGVERCRDPRDQEVRLQKAGFETVRHMTIDGIWDSWVSLAEKQRVNRLEGGLDEVEEWKLLAGHYIVVWGFQGEGLGCLRTSPSVWR